MIVKKKLKSLYAPWRKKYILGSLENKDDSKTCPFCKTDEEYQVFETKKTMIRSNKYPYSSGHLLVIPKRHINDITNLTTKESEELFNLINLSVYLLDIYMKPEGYNIGCSVGKIAGESIDHLHFHVLPRFAGDVGWNRLGDFNVISESPKETTKNLKKIIKEQRLPKKFGIY
jgi:ATP adenylyltransferase